MPVTTYVAGISEALLRLTQDETNAQAEQYVAKDRRARSAEDLNQLRTFARVAQTAEDLSGFERFAADAHLDQMQQSIVDAVEVLFNVQTAAAETRQARREQILNVVAIALASLTLVSVSVDAYNFVREDQTPDCGPHRAHPALLFLIPWLVSLGRRRRSHRGGAAARDGPGAVEAPPVQVHAAVRMVWGHVELPRRQSSRRVGWLTQALLDELWIFHRRDRSTVLVDAYLGVRRMPTDSQP